MDITVLLGEWRGAGSPSSRQQIGGTDYPQHQMRIRPPRQEADQHISSSNQEQPGGRKPDVFTVVQERPAMGTVRPVCLGQIPWRVWRPPALIRTVETVQANRAAENPIDGVADRRGFLVSASTRHRLLCSKLNVHLQAICIEATGDTDVDQVVGVFPCPAVVTGPMFIEIEVASKSGGRSGGPLARE